MNIGIIGLGSIGERHVRNLQSLYPAIRIEVLTKRRKWHGAGKRTTLTSSRKAFFARQHDVYFITNETNKHARTILKCLAQKPRGIFVEKPLAHNFENAKKVAAAAANYRGVFHVGYNLHYFEPLLTVKRMLDQKKIGKPLFVRVFAGQDLRTWRSRNYKKGYASRALGGGVILDLIHDLNYPSWLLGRPISFVTGFATHASDLSIASEDVAEGFFIAAKTKVPVSVHVDYLRNPGERSCEIVGTRGVLIWRWALGTNRHEVMLNGHTKRLVVDAKDMYVDELRAFIRDVRAKKRHANLKEALGDMKNATIWKKHRI